MEVTLLSSTMASESNEAGTASQSNKRQSPPKADRSDARSLQSNTYFFMDRDSPTSALSFPSSSHNDEGESNARNTEFLQTPLLQTLPVVSPSASTNCSLEESSTVHNNSSNNSNVLDSSYSGSCFEGIDESLLTENDDDQSSKHVAFHTSAQVRYFSRSSSEIASIKEFQATEKRRRRKIKRERIRQILEEDDDASNDGGGGGQHRDEEEDDSTIEHRAPLPTLSIFQQMYGDILDLFSTDDSVVGKEDDNEQPWFPIQCIRPQCAEESSHVVDDDTGKLQ